MRQVSTRTAPPAWRYVLAATAGLCGLAFALYVVFTVLVAGDVSRFFSQATLNFPLLMLWPCSFMALCLRRLALVPCSTERHLLDWLLAVGGVLTWAQLFIVFAYPFDTASAAVLLVFATLHVALAVRGIWWPDEVALAIASATTGDAPGVEVPAPGTARPSVAQRNWRSRVVASLFAGAVLPLAFLAIAVSGMDPPRDSWQYHVPQFFLLAVINASIVGMWSGVRIPPKPPSAEQEGDGTAFDLIEGDTSALERTGVLLSRTTTTGWRDWMHGELWLFADGLLRIPMGWTRTLLSVGYFYNARCPRVRHFDVATFTTLIADHRTIWIARNAILAASLGHTLGADELRATLTDGRAIHLLWMRRDGVFAALQSPLRAWIGERLVVKD